MGARSILPTNETYKEPRNVTDFFTPEQLRAETKAIAASGALGRSKYYAALLEFLAEAALVGGQPKEIELAIEVLDKEPNFDVAADSSVRVYVHQLRKKLDEYYKQNLHLRYRLVIPKGQYTLVAQDRGKKHSAVLMTLANWRSSGLVAGLLSLCAVLLAANLIVGLPYNWPEAKTNAAPSHPLWQALLADEQPILLVMGDYYIFGELNDTGNIARMVREFDVNSPEDLEELQFTEIERAKNYLDLNLSYMPEGSAYALTRLMPLLQSAGKTINVAMMSDLSSADIHDNHIVYIGYISALDKLTEMTFASSGLGLGRSYDELYDRESLQYFTSDAGLPAKGEAFKDYGMFSMFPASSETQIVVIAGMRDAGLMHTAKALTDPDSLAELLTAIDQSTQPSVSSFEALYEVFGVDRLNFDANLVYTNSLDPKLIWTKSLKGRSRSL